MRACMPGDEEQILPRPGLADGIGCGLVQSACRNSQSGCEPCPGARRRHAPRSRDPSRRAAGRSRIDPRNRDGPEHPHLGPQEQCGPSAEYRRRRAEQMHVATALAQRGADAEQVDRAAVGVADDPLSREDADLTCRGDRAPTTRSAASRCSRSTSGPRSRAATRGRRIACAAAPTPVAAASMPTPGRRNRSARWRLARRIAIAASSRLSRSPTHMAAQPVVRREHRFQRRAGQPVRDGLAVLAIEVQQLRIDAKPCAAHEKAQDEVVVLGDPQRCVVAEPLSSIRLARISGFR